MKESRLFLQKQSWSQNLWKGGENCSSTQMFSRWPNAMGAFPIHEVWFSLKYRQDAGALFLRSCFHKHCTPPGRPFCSHPALLSLAIRQDRCGKSPWLGAKILVVRCTLLTKTVSNLSTKVPRYPASAQKASIEGYFSQAFRATRIPDFVSWMFAAWTVTASKFPIVSTTMCRFLPFVFSSVNSALFTVYHCFDTLRINKCITWICVSSCIQPNLFNQMNEDFLP